MTHTFSVHEYIDMVKCYFRNNESHRQAAYSYGIEYPDRKKPSYNVINRLMSRFLGTGKITLSLSYNKVANFGIWIRPDRSTRFRVK